MPVVTIMFLHISKGKRMKNASETKTRPVCATPLTDASRVKSDWNEANHPRRGETGTATVLHIRKCGESYRPQEQHWKRMALTGEGEREGGGEQGRTVQDTWGRQRRAPEQLVELGQVGDHGGLIRLLVAAHLFLWGERPDPKLALADVQGQLQVRRMVLLIQRVKISDGRRKKCDYAKQWNNWAQNRK